MGELEVLKVLASLGSTGMVMAVGYFLLRENRSASEKRDERFTETIKEVTADVKEGLADLKETVSSVKGALDDNRQAMIAMDRDHTLSQRETFNQLLQLNDKQNGAISMMVQKVEHLDDTVDGLSATVKEHGVKLDSILKSLPPPRAIEPPGLAPGGDFRPPRA